MPYIEPPDLGIPGVSDNARLIEWIDDYNLWLHPNLSIESSPLGGIGLFFNDDNIKVPEDEDEDDLRVLRIPSNYGLDYLNLLQLLHIMKVRDKSYDTIPIKESELIVNILNGLEPTSETQILCCYLTGMAILKKLRKGRKLSYYKNSPLIPYDIYLEILLNTFTLDYPEDPVGDEDEFILDYVKKARNIRFEYDSLIEQLNVLYNQESVQFEEVLPFTTFYKIALAVRSRTLEIPHESEDGRSMRSRNNSVQVTVNNHDFYINVTLVPILDFANHSHNNNAYFDIDRRNGDIILKIKKDKLKNSGKFEVTISYSPVESIQHFITTYGFIPSLIEGDEKHFQLFEYKFPRLDDFVENGTYICKWLRTLPQIQLVIGNNEVYLNFFNNNFPFLFIDGLEYNEKWPTIAVQNFKEFNQLDDEYDIDDEEVATILMHQEERYDVINGVQSIGLKYKGKVIKDLSSILEQTGYEDEDAFDELIHKTIKFVVHYSEVEIKKMPLRKPRNSFDAMVTSFQKFKHHILQLLISKYNYQPRSLILPEDIAEEEWETNYRSVPKELPLE
ncbi:cytochrome c methyltransferase [Scheffersomyces xylosifermentans]|uniref:cytochrome c methyltransferase n=1 Tax=Scheffersomyces xylosifermentans TaxID=1304137 RepID=UPI00315DBDBC